VHDCQRQDRLLSLNVFDGLGERVQAAHDQRLLDLVAGEVLGQRLLCDPTLRHVMIAGVGAQLLVNLGRQIRLDAYAVSHDRCLVGTDRRNRWSNRHEKHARSALRRNRADHASGIDKSAVPNRS
jgi:hypothetical protein